ncbi:DNA repair protein RecO [Candidatus Saccharibacteria bacterium]|nr:DNA repair protein RecO [Candidatus Saccharibacteria bacterium]
MGATYQTTGIVLSRTNFGEADRIIRFITPEHGKISAVAKGIRRVKSKSGGHLEPFGEVALMLATGRNLDVVTSARLVWYPHELTANYERLGLAFIIASLVDRFAQPGEPQPELYAHTRMALGAVEAGESGPLVELWFKLRLLAISGLQPSLDQCLVCGRSDADSRYWFEAERGGLTCDDDRGAVASPMSQPAIKLWRLLFNYPYATIARIGGASEMAASSLADCDDFYDAHGGHSVRSGTLGATL